MQNVFVGDSVNFPQYLKSYKCEFCNVQFTIKCARGTSHFAPHVTVIVSCKSGNLFGMSGSKIIKMSSQLAKMDGSKLGAQC